MASIVGEKGSFRKEIPAFLYAILTPMDSMDHEIKPTEFRWWGVALALVLFFGMAMCLWGFFGHITPAVFGKGLLINPARHAVITCPAIGQIQTLSVKEGSVVTAGAVIATVADPEIRLQIKQTEQLLQSLTLYSMILRKYKDTPAENVLSLKKKIRFYEDKLSRLNRKLEAPVVVKAPLFGKVTSLRVFEGNRVHRDMMLMRVTERLAQTLEAIVLVPAKTAAYLTPGMRVYLEPSSLPHREYGWLHGRVKSISSALATAGYLGQWIDPVLLQRVLKSPFLIEIRVELIRDPRTKSGFAWSTHEGPPFLLTPGTFVKAQFNLQDEPPFFYFYRKFKGFY